MQGMELQEKQKDKDDKHKECWLKRTHTHTTYALDVCLYVKIFSDIHNVY